MRRQTPLSPVETPLRGTAVGCPRVRGAITPALQGQGRAMRPSWTLARRRLPRRRYPAGSGTRLVAAVVLGFIQGLVGTGKELLRGPWRSAGTPRCQGRP